MKFAVSLRPVLAAQSKVKKTYAISFLEDSD